MTASYPHSGALLDTAIGPALKAQLDRSAVWLALEPGADAVVLGEWPTHRPVGACALIPAPLLTCDLLACDTRQWSGSADVQLFIPLPPDLERATQGQLCLAVAAQLRDSLVCQQLTPLTVTLGCDLVSFARGEMTGAVPRDPQGGEVDADGDDADGWTTLTTAGYNALLRVRLRSLGL
jgi:hypothetical protein